MFENYVIFQVSFSILLSYSFFAHHCEDFLNGNLFKEEAKRGPFEKQPSQIEKREHGFLTYSLYFL